MKLETHPQQSNQTDGYLPFRLSFRTDECPATETQGSPLPPWWTPALLSKLGLGSFGWRAPSWCGCSAGVRSLRIRKEDLLLLVSGSLVKMPELEEERYSLPLDWSFQSIRYCWILSLSPLWGLQLHWRVVVWAAFFLWPTDLIAIGEVKYFHYPLPQNTEIFKGNPGGRLAS